jgi:hypothetical protein
MGRVEMAPGWEHKMDKEIEKFLNHLSERVLHLMEALCPVETGYLKADLAKEVHGKVARIGAKTAPYAIYVEEGTGPHTIEPNTAGALNWAGLAHPVNIVHHPGTHATHFMKRALYGGAE